MGWSVGYDFTHRRFRGYGVPGYCDAKGCRVEIDRGLGYVCECDAEVDEEACWAIDAVEKDVFVCGDHSCADVEEDDLPPEHPDWVAHVLNDESWSEWRVANPEEVARYEALEASE